jgi:tungstate transport system substrate-binding protein
MAKTKNKLIVASTTSTQNSGLFDILIQAYEKFSKYQAKVEVIAVGTGKAIRLAKKGGADVLFVHDPFREDKFIAEGYGVNRREVMYNEFAIVGPAKDPAKVAKAQTAIEAFEDIAETGNTFISRGDDSGTNIRELDLWDDVGINPKGKSWYQEVGASMAITLERADKEGAYTLSDMGTFLKYEPKLKLKVLFRGDPLLLNYYSVMAVCPDRFPRANYLAAMEFIAFVTSAEGQKLIAGYKKHGTNLFYPEAIPSVIKGKK